MTDKWGTLLRIKIDQNSVRHPTAPGDCVIDLLIEFDHGVQFTRSIGTSTRKGMVWYAGRMVECIRARGSLCKISSNEDRFDQFLIFDAQDRILLDSGSLFIPLPDR